MKLVFLFFKMQLRINNRTLSNQPETFFTTEVGSREKNSGKCNRRDKRHGLTIKS